VEYKIVSDNGSASTVVVFGVPETEEEGVKFLRNVANFTMSVDSSLQQSSKRNVKNPNIFT
jgi:hypothetical protein